MYSPGCSARTLLTIIPLLLLMFFCPALECLAGQAELAWNASSDPTVTGYKVYYGTQSRTYPNVLDAKANLTQSVTGLSETQPYYFAATAYSSDAESDYSQELICYGISISAPSNGQILPANSMILAAGSSQTLSIVPNSGFVITDVQVDGNSVGPVSQYQFSNLNSCHTISATFSSISYTIVANSQGSGSITPSGSVGVAAGQNETFTITPAANNAISGVTVDGTSVGAVSSYTFTGVTANHTITATFAPATYTISASVQGSGSISPSGSVSVAGGQNATFTITPAANNAISGVTVDGTSVGAVSSYTFTGVTANHTITATFAPATYTISASVQGSGSISPSGSVSVAGGQNATFTITPAANNAISGVTVDGTSVGAVSSYTFTGVTANHTITATFAPAKYTISASVQGSGSISPSGSVSVAGGQNATFTITPAANNAISGVTVDGTSVGAVSSYTFTGVTANHTIIATFAPAAYTISASIQGSGSISPSGSVNLSSGQNQTFTITPAANNKIAEVLVDGSSVGTVSSYSFSHVSGNHTITAVFSPITFTIYASSAGSGNISPSGNVSVASGKSQTFNFVPFSNNKVVQVLVDGSSVGVASSYTFSNISGNHTILAVFSGSYEISASTKGKGTISPIGNIGVSSGETMPFTITPAPNYQVADVTVDGTSVGAVTSYQFVNITASHTIQATFTPAVHTITSSVQGNGTISPTGAVKVNAGTGKTYKIAAASKQRIADVAVDGCSVGAVSKYSFSKVAGDHNILAVFTPITYTIVASAQANGTISPPGSTVLTAGSTQTYTILPSTNYKIAEVKVDGKSVGAVSSYSFTDIGAHHSITAIFAPITYTISASSHGHGTISPTGATKVVIGNNQAYTDRCIRKQQDSGCGG